MTWVNYTEFTDGNRIKNSKRFMMKKLLSLIITFIFICSSTVFANARWDNPTSIRTYIEPNNKKELMKEAFAKWTQITNKKIIFKYVSSPQDAQITVEFVKDASKATNMEHAAGVTYPQYIGNRLISAKIIIADNAPNGGLFRKEAAYRIMLHEIGHAIGIFDHSQDRMSIMYYAKVSRNQSITEDDLELLGKIYSW